jgi:hypothetical protein
MNSLVRDMMTTDVVTVEASTPFKEIVARLAGHRVSAVPVVDACACSTSSASPVRADSSRTAVAPRTSPSTATTPGLTSSRSPGRSFRQRRRDQRAVLVAVHDPGSALQQGAQLPPGPVPRIGLQQLARGEHHRDHRPGQLLAQGQGPAHGQQRDQVHAGLPAPQRTGDRDGQRQQPGGHGQGEDAVAQLARAGQPRPEAAGQPGQRHREQHGGPPARRDPGPHCPSVAAPGHRPKGPTPPSGGDPGPCGARRRSCDPVGSMASRRDNGLSVSRKR